MDSWGNGAVNSSTLSRKLNSSVCVDPVSPQQMYNGHNHNYSNQNGGQYLSVYDYEAVGGVDLPRNPVLERLTGKREQSASRNESYYKVNHLCSKIHKFGRN